MSGYNNGDYNGSYRDDWQDRRRDSHGNYEHSGNRYWDQDRGKGKGDSFHDDGKGKGKGKSGYQRQEDILNVSLAGGAATLRLYPSGHDGDRVLWVKSKQWSQTVVDQTKAAIESILAANDPATIKATQDAEAMARVLNTTLVPTLNRIDDSLARRNEREASTEVESSHDTGTPANKKPTPPSRKNAHSVKFKGLSDTVDDNEAPTPDKPSPNQSAKSGKSSRSASWMHGMVKGQVKTLLDLEGSVDATDDFMKLAAFIGIDLPVEPKSVKGIAKCLDYLTEELCELMKSGHVKAVPTREELEKIDAQDKVSIVKTKANPSKRKVKETAAPAQRRQRKKTADVK